MVAIHGFDEVSNNGSYAIQENDLSTLFHCWKKFLPMYFMMSKEHYARYNPDSSLFFAMISSENSSVWCNRNLDFLTLRYNTNILRYGSSYISFMENLMEKFPAEFKDLLENGLSVQAHDKYLLATASYQREKQTINRDAKSVGENVICSISNALETNN